MLICSFLRQILAEVFDSFAECKSSLVSLGLMTSVSSAMFSQVWGKALRTCQKREPRHLQYPHLLYLGTLTSCRKTVPHHRLGSKHLSLLSPIKLPLLCAQLISPALQQNTVGPQLGRKLSEVGPSPLLWKAHLKCWHWPGLSSLSQSSSGPDVCPFILHPNSSRALCQAGCAGSAGLPALSQAQQPVQEGLGREH